MIFYEQKYRQNSCESRKGYKVFSNDKNQAVQNTTCRKIQHFIPTTKIWKYNGKDMKLEIVFFNLRKSCTVERVFSV